ncbi:putative ankyrin repeat protein [Botrytis fragariae]|uniref:Putative ankyrin repeat protein n=1 Tax=Botrytis fragariae TaxID=1964551 RepID=A0A8H6B555_9HELO|nr:putative ankyrin repeat protein [Botrytis fragariae]KAF5879373.1 putative ankyrin repeat protein [Botrytis fragariae]
MDSHGVLPNRLMNYGQTRSHERHNITQDISHINAEAGSRLFVGTNITYEAAVPIRDEILKWLDPEDLRISQYKEHTRYREDRADDTGEDFLNGDFKKWASSNKKFLWLRGQVGSGKTMICSHLIENIPNILRITSPGVTSNNAHLVAFYYCSFSDNSTFDVGNFQRSIIAQLCDKYGLLPELKELYENCKPYPPSTVQLTTLLLSIVSSLKSSTATLTNSEKTEACRSTTLVIDGLDEVPLESHGMAIFRIVVVSREEGDLKASFSKDYGWRWLIRDTAHVTLDIEQFVQARISNHRRLNSQSTEIKTLISRRLSQGSEGMFRLAALQMKELEYLTRNLRVIQKADLENIFLSLPRDLDTFYDLIISRMPNSLLSELETVLKWLIFAARPLFVEEIVEVCTIRPIINGLPCIGSRRHALDIVESLPGLVKLEPPIADDVEIVPQGVHILSIAHFSVQEYLCPIHDFNRPPGLFRFTDIYKEHQMIAQACLSYLLHCLKSKDGRTAAFHLREYCWYSWSMHMTATTDSHDLKARTTADSLRLHNSIANPILYKRRSEVVSMEAARLRSFADIFTPKMYAELLVALQDLEFPFDDSGVSERSINSQQTPYKTILGHCPDATRLVILYPSNNPDSPLRCGICTDSLDNNPDYVALSYAWGKYNEEMLMLKVYGNGFSLRLRPNLHSALVHLREETEPRMLWIDAICIDMQNFEERSFQIRLMARLYSQAQEVIMWLGESRNSSETITSEAKAMSVLNMETSLDGNLTPYWETWDSVDALFRRSLWSRAWTIQESVVATKLTVMCGQYASSFDHWHDIRELRRKKLDSECRLPRLLSNQRFKADEAAWDAVIAVQALRNRYRKNGRMELELATLLFLSRRHISSDYRDKLYALLSLLGDKERSDPLLHPDYSLSPAEMAHKLTVYVSKKYQNLTILESSFGADNSENLSSWTLDLYALRRPIVHESSDAIQQSTLQDSHDASQAYNAGGNYILDDHPFTFSSDLKTLKVWGVVIDSVIDCDLELRLSDNIYWESSRGKTIAFNCRRYVRCLGPESVRRGDLVVVLFGSIVPFLLRKIQVDCVQAEPGPSGGRYKLIGACYAEGIMKGEILEAYQAGDNEGQEFWLE